MPSGVVFGQELDCVPDIIRSLEEAAASSFEFIVVPLFHPRMRRDAQTLKTRTGPATKSDRILNNSQWVSNVVGSVSSWIDLDNTAECVRQSSEIAFKQEVNWAIHLGLQTIVLPRSLRLNSPNLSRYLRVIFQQIELTYQQLWLRVPLTIPFDYRVSDDSDDDGWFIWDHIYRMSGCNHKLSLILEIDEILPKDLDICLSRWKAEPIKAVILPTRLFLTNKHGFPVLPKSHQRVLSNFFDRKLHVILSGKSRHENSYSAYIQYLRHMKNQATSTLTFDEKFTEAYKDTLQSPLQPLMDNLESSTYETFERDPVKYSQYQVAVAKALVTIRDRTTEAMVSVKAPVPITLFVVGAGRGPLVACSLAAASEVGVPIFIYAVEKNENAVITLRNRSISEGWTNVKIVANDMRKWKSDILADIIVSELLGSFGCNELSPECMDGVQQHLKTGGIMIPQKYVSYIAPVSSPRLWMGARDLPGRNGLDTPFVVKFSQCNVLSSAMPVFEFLHPKFDDSDDNSRFATVTFVCPYSSTIHGFQGTFESLLFSDVLISIRQETFTENMFSWFPMFIPLHTPLRVEKNQTITVHIWRCIDARKVWYEWCVSSPCVTPIQNSGGKSYWIGY